MHVPLTMPTAVCQGCRTPLNWEIVVIFHKDLFLDWYSGYWGSSPQLCRKSKKTGRVSWEGRRRRRLWSMSSRQRRGRSWGELSLLLVSEFDWLCWWLLLAVICGPCPWRLLRKSLSILEPNKKFPRLASNQGCEIVHFVQHDVFQVVNLWVQTLDHRNQKVNQVIKLWVWISGITKLS